MAKLNFRVMDLGLVMGYGLWVKVYSRVIGQKSIVQKIIKGGATNAAIKGDQIIASVSPASVLGGLLIILLFNF